MNTIKTVFYFFSKISNLIYFLFWGAYSCVKSNYESYTGKAKSFEEQVKIMKICEPCEFRSKDRCGVCGCVLKDKIAPKDTICPIGKW